jgi:hypothetical protein
MIDPGLYQMSFRGLTLGEAWRFAGNPLTFAIALVLKAGGMKGAKTWLPTHQVEVRCDPAELSEGARRHLLPEVEKARALGYGDGHFLRQTRNDDPSTKEGFAYLALHADRVRALFIGYVVNTAGGSEKTAVRATGGIRLSGGGDLVFYNHNNFLDGEPDTRRLMVKSSELAALDAAMAAELAKLGMEARSFSSWDDMKAHANEGDERAFAGRIRRGLFVRVRE